MVLYYLSRSDVNKLQGEIYLNTEVQECKKGWNQSKIMKVQNINNSFVDSLFKNVVIYIQKGYHFNVWRRQTFITRASFLCDFRNLTVKGIKRITFNIVDILRINGFFLNNSFSSCTTA